MAPESQPVDRWNYFNYFTEVEEQFQRSRGTGLFLMSPLDWALVETWKNDGVPLEAVLRGIEAAFEKWHAKLRKGRMVNSLAYCAQAVHEEAQAIASGTPVTREPAKAPFELDELRTYLEKNAAALRSRGGFEDVAAALDGIRAEAETHYASLEALEQRLTMLEDKMAAMARAALSEDQLLAIRRDLDAALRPYRGKMSTAELANLERKYLDTRIQERAGLPRLSLFYLMP
jgi:hypothetical protein